MIVYTSEQVRQREADAEKLGISKMLLMENAGRAVADIARKMYDPIFKPRILAVCGPGNNGGDAMVAARHLSKTAQVVVLLLGLPNKLRTDEARNQWKILENMGLRQIIVNTKEDVLKIANEFEGIDIILDGIFGTGVKGPIGEPFYSAIKLINESSALKISIDVPSGLNPDTGEAGEPSVNPDAVISFFGIKKGLLKLLNKDISVFVDPLV